MKDEQVKKGKREKEKKETGPFSHINTKTTAMATKRDYGISESFAKEIGLSNKG